LSVESAASGTRSLSQRTLEKKSALSLQCMLVYGKKCKAPINLSLLSRDSNRDGPG
ncbi:hypothetical protein MPH_12256, partial [Macrophomina phaseolina MS6]